MEDDKTQVYEKLPRKEMFALRKEYFREINPQARILKWIGLGLYIPFFAVVGRVAYNFYLFFTGTPSWFMTWNYTFMLFALIVMCLVMFGEKSFTRWLWKDKNILSSEWKKPRNPDVVEKSYKYLSKQEKQKLRKEYFTEIGKSAKYWAIAIVAVFLVLIHAVVEIFLYWHWQILLSRTIGIITFIGFIVFVYKGLFFAKYWQWLECEKGIVKKRVG